MGQYPTGAQHELRLGDQTAVVVEVGAGLREYAVAGRPVLDGYAATDRIDGGRGQVLMPWPNRIGGGRYRWGDRDLQLALTEPTAGNAIHGLLRWTSWDVIERADDRVVMGATVWPQPGYPFVLSARAGYALTADGLTVTLRAHNESDEPAPYGVGQHPYVTVGTDRVDSTELTVPAATWIRTDERGLPVATEAVPGSAYDFRAARPVGDQRLDTAFADLTPDAAGRVTVRVADPAAGGHGVELWMDSAARYLQVYTGDTLPDPARRRQGLAVEPMSCPPDAFRTGEGLVVLEPGQSHALTWGLRAW